MDIELGKHLNITESYKWRVVLFKITILMTNCKVKEKITPNKKKKILKMSLCTYWKTRVFNSVFSAAYNRTPKYMSKVKIIFVFNCFCVKLNKVTLWGKNVGVKKKKERRKEKIPSPAPHTTHERDPKSSNSGNGQGTFSDLEVKTQSKSSRGHQSREPVLLGCAEKLSL